MEREKPKTYMLRLYPDSASDQILINYLKEKRNVQQYLRQLIEDDIENKNIVKTIREVIKECFQANGQMQQSYSQPESKNDNSPIIEKEEQKKKQEILIPEQIGDEVFENEDEVEVDLITPEAFDFLKSLGQ